MLHSFDGDGMLHGVYFSKETDGQLTPYYVNKYIQTDILLACRKRGRTLVPSIASLIAPIAKYPINLLIMLMRTMSICYLSSLSRLSAANTTIVFHNKKLLATCESGPMMRVSAPELDTHGWEIFYDEQTGQGLGKGKQVVGKSLGNTGKMLEEWTTGHPKVCPSTGDLVMFSYNIFAAPYVTYSVIKADGKHSPAFKVPIPFVERPKMMHDFAASLHHSIILDLPLTMDPLNIVLAQPMLNFNRSLPSRFIVLPRYYDGTDKSEVKIFEAPEPSLIFHTCNAWDEGSEGEQYAGDDTADALHAINMYGCRFRTSEFVYGAGGMRPPDHEDAISRELADKVRLAYYRFSMSDNDPLRNAASSSQAGQGIDYAFCLSAIPFEFPVINEKYRMQKHQYAYGCTAKHGIFSALDATKTDCIVKLNVEALRLKGIEMSNEGRLQPFGEVDERLPSDILTSQEAGIKDAYIEVFCTPPGVYLQEPSFVPRADAKSEDDGYLLFYTYDESQLLPNGEAPEDSKSQMYIVDAAQMSKPHEQCVIAIIDLPARVPYGLHSNFITADQIESQILKRRTQSDAVEPAQLPKASTEGIAVVEQVEAAERSLLFAEEASKSLGAATALVWVTSLMTALTSRVKQSHYSPAARKQRLQSDQAGSSTSEEVAAMLSSLMPQVLQKIQAAHYSPQALAAARVVPAV